MNLHEIYLAAQLAKNDINNNINLSDYYTKSQTEDLISEKVNNADGMGLSQNSFTNAEKSKLSDLENYDDTEIKDNISGVSSQAVLNRSTLGYQAKNLMKNTAVSATKYGITFTVNDDKSVTLNGTATASVWFRLSTDNKISAGRYIVTSGVDGYGTNIRVCISPTTAIGDIILDSTQGDKKLSSQDGLIYAIRVQSNFTAENITVYPMLRDAEITNDTYEPYKPSVGERLAALEEKLTALDSAIFTAQSMEINNTIINEEETI